MSNEGMPTPSRPASEKDSGENKSVRRSVGMYDRPAKRTLPPMIWIALAVFMLLIIAASILFLLPR